MSLARIPFINSTYKYRLGFCKAIQLHSGYSERVDRDSLRPAKVRKNQIVGISLKPEASNKLLSIFRWCNCIHMSKSTGDYDRANISKVPRSGHVLLIELFLYLPRKILHLSQKHLHIFQVFEERMTLHYTIRCNIGNLRSGTISN